MFDKISAHLNIEDFMTKQEEFYKTIKENDINNFKILLNDKRVNPSECNNDAILYASENGHFFIVQLLLNDERIKSSLKKDRFDFFYNLIKKQNKKKIQGF